MEKFTQIYDHIEQRICGTELKDDRDRLIRITAFVDEDHEEVIEHDYADIDENLYYKCEERYSLINTKLDRVEKTSITKCIYSYGIEYPFYIETKIFDEATNSMITTECYEFEITSEDIDDRKYIIKCIDVNTHKSITYTIDRLNDSIISEADEIHDIYTTTDTYFVGEKPEDRYQVIIEETSTGKPGNEEYIKIKTFIYDNGLYERNFKYDENDKFRGGYIRVYFTGGMISHEYEVDEDYEVSSGRYYIYNNSEPVCIHDGMGNVLFEFFDGNKIHVPKEYPNIDLRVGTNYSDNITS